MAIAEPQEESDGLVPPALTVRWSAPARRLPTRRWRCGQRARTPRSKWRRHEPAPCGGVRRTWLTQSVS